jgi:hypothetical protein
MEACVAARYIDNAGEMNGYLKPRRHLLVNPPRFDAGALWLAPDYQPLLDRDVVNATRVDGLCVWRDSLASVPSCPPKREGMP